MNRRYSRLSLGSRPIFPRQFEELHGSEMLGLFRPCPAEQLACLVNGRDEISSLTPNLAVKLQQESAWAFRLAVGFDAGINTEDSG